MSRTHTWECSICKKQIDMAFADCPYCHNVKPDYKKAAELIESWMKEPGDYDSKVWYEIVGEIENMKCYDNWQYDGLTRKDRENMKEIKIGQTFRYDGYKNHIVAILREEPEAQIVYKYYGRYKQWWHYGVIAEYLYRTTI